MTALSRILTPTIWTFWTETEEGRQVLQSLTAEDLRQIRQQPHSVAKRIAEHGGPALPIIAVIASGGAMALRGQGGLSMGVALALVLAVMAVAFFVGLVIESRLSNWAYPQMLKDVVDPLANHPDLCTRCLTLLKDPDVRAYRDAVVSSRELVRLDYHAMEGLLQFAARRRVCAQVHGLAALD